MTNILFTMPLYERDIIPQYFLNFLEDFDTASKDPDNISIASLFTTKEQVEKIKFVAYGDCILSARYGLLFKSSNDNAKQYIKQVVGESSTTYIPSLSSPLFYNNAKFLKELMLEQGYWQAKLVSYYLGYMLISDEGKQQLSYVPQSIIQLLLHITNENTHHLHNAAKILLQNMHDKRANLSTLKLPCPEYWQKYRYSDIY